MTMNSIFFSVLLVTFVSINALAQNSNSSTTTERPRTTNTNRSTQEQAPAPKPAPAPGARAARPKPPATQTQPSGNPVVDAFNKLLDGIRKTDVNEVMSVYWNSPQLIHFNNNGTVTKGWQQVKKNRESSYPDLTDVKLEVRDVSVTMLGRDGAVVSCLWTQSQTYKGTPETATGRMTLVFRRIGKEWKAVHLHTSPDKPEPSRVLPSEQPTPSPTPN